MAATLYRTGTELVWVRLTDLRTPLASDTPVGFYATPDPGIIPAVADFVDAILVLPDHPTLGDGVDTWIAQLVGPGSPMGALVPGDYQLFVLVEAGSEKIIRKPGVLEVL